MNRKEMIRFINTEICPQIDFRLDIDFGDCIKMIERYRIGKPINIKMEAIVNDGFLYINSEPLGRIAPKLPKVECSEWGYYLEGRCIRDEDY